MILVNIRQHQCKFLPPLYEILLMNCPNSQEYPLYLNICFNSFDVAEEWNAVISLQNMLNISYTNIFIYLFACSGDLSTSQCTIQWTNAWQRIHIQLSGALQLFPWFPVVGISSQTVSAGRLMEWPDGVLCQYVFMTTCHLVAIHGTWMTSQIW